MSGCTKKRFGLFITVELESKHRKLVALHKNVCTRFILIIPKRFQVIISLMAFKKGALPYHPIMFGG
jgi:hypothetical protein